MMRLICSYIILAFSLFTTLAFLINKNIKKDIKLLEFIGQLCIIAFLILQIYNLRLIGDIALISGSIIIMLACILNGKYTFGKINISHHIFRGVFLAINIFFIIIG